MKKASIPLHQRTKPSSPSLCVESAFVASSPAATMGGVREQLFALPHSSDSLVQVPTSTMSLCSSDCNDTRHECTCRSGNRSLMLLVASLNRKAQRELRRRGQELGTWKSSIDGIEVKLGPSRTFQSAASVLQYVREILKQDIGLLRAAWVDPNLPLEQQLITFIKAKPLSSMVSGLSTPLAAILQNQTLETWFQPIFDVKTLSIWGYECLIRARDTNGDVISPLDLIRWAKEENELPRLDRLCREIHIRNIAKANVPEHCKFLINFIPTVIYDPAVCLETTFQAVKKYNIPANRIVFEVVEGEAIEDHKHLRLTIDEYRKSGFQVALDDLGAGHSGLTLLGNLAPDIIKIDRDIVSQAASSVIHETICRSIAGLAESTGQILLAEGVETEADWKMVKGLGVDYVQGYLFGKPSPEPAIDPLFRP